MNPAADPPPTLADATAFLVDRIAALRRREPAEIDPTLPFNALGIDSLDAISLMGEVETRFAIAIDPNEIFDHPTPALLARAITERITRHG